MEVENKTYKRREKGMKHIMHLQKKPFSEIKSRVKTVEIRLCDEKRKEVKRGDEILFDCEGETICVEVVDLFHFAAFSDLFSSSLRDKCGSAGLSKEECVEQMRQYYSCEDEKKYGVLAIQIKLVI